MHNNGNHEQICNAKLLKRKSLSIDVNSKTKLLTFSMILAVLIMSGTATIGNLSTPLNNYPINDTAFNNQSNEAFMNFTYTYYNNIGTNVSGTARLSSSVVNQEYWNFSKAPVGVSRTINSSLVFSVGNYQYVAGSTVGSNCYDGAGSNGAELGFLAGLDNYGQANVGTIYAYLIISNVTSNVTLEMLLWSQSYNVTCSSSNQYITFSPYWAPNVQTGYYHVSIYLGVTPYTNYNLSDPSDFYTQYTGTTFYWGEVGSQPAMSGWFYSCATAAFSIKVPSNTTAFQFEYQSPYALRVNIGGLISHAFTNNTISYYSSSYNGGQFQGVVGDPNTPNFTVQYSIINVITKNKANNSLTSARNNVTENGNWFNSTYSFKLDAPVGSLDGKYLDGKNWNTTWIYSISHILDPEFNQSSPINYFYLNGGLVSNPLKYNNVSGNIEDSSQANFTCLETNASVLLNYYPDLISSGAAETSVYIGLPVTYFVNTSESILGEKSSIIVNWTDGSVTQSNISSELNFTIDHTFAFPGNYTPVFNIVNFPDADNGSLSSQQFSLPTISVEDIPINGKTNVTSVNPLQPVEFIVSVPQIIKASNDTLRINFGDNTTSSDHSSSNFTAYHSYLTNGTFEPQVQVIFKNTVVQSQEIGRITVGPLDMTPFSRYLNGTVHLQLNYSSLTIVKNISLYVNNKLVEEFYPGNLKGILFYNYSMYTPLEASYVWVATTLYGYVQNDMTNFNLPEMSGLSYLNPANPGVPVSYNISYNYVSSFYYSLFIDGVQVESHLYNAQPLTYTYGRPGEYNITFLAVNGYGSVSTSIEQNISFEGPLLSVEYSSRVPLDVTSTFYSNVSYQANNESETWIVDNVIVLKNSTILSYKFQTLGTHIVKVVAADAFGSTETNISIVVYNTTPVITSLDITPTNPETNSTVTLIANIDWVNNTTGSIIWLVNDVKIEGNTHIFSTSGTYNITAVATNEYGISSQKTEEVIVTSAESSPTPPPTPPPLPPPTNASYKGSNSKIMNYVIISASVAVIAVLLSAAILQIKRRKL